MAAAWIKLQDKIPDAYLTIQAGLDKLDVYCQRAEIVPAYVVAMSALHISCSNT